MRCSRVQARDAAQQAERGTEPCGLEHRDLRSKVRCDWPQVSTRWGSPL